MRVLKPRLVGLQSHLGVEVMLLGRKETWLVQELQAKGVTQSIINRLHVWARSDYPVNFIFDDGRQVVGHDD